MLCDDEFLYVGYWVEEPLVAAKFTERDSPICQDNDVESFIAGRDGYYEFETCVAGRAARSWRAWRHLAAFS